LDDHHPNPEALHLEPQGIADPDQAEDVRLELAAKVVELTSNSPYAAELYDRHGTLSGDIAGQAQGHAEKIIATVLRRAVAAGEIDLAASGLTLAQLAAVLTDCAHGAKGEDPSGTTPVEFATRLGNSVRAIISGVGRST
jgi:hypothetical protein